jgi:hypothetical protein
MFLIVVGVNWKRREIGDKDKTIVASGNSRGCEGGSGTSVAPCPHPHPHPLVNVQFFR